MLDGADARDITVTSTVTSTVGTRRRRVQTNDEVTKSRIGARRFAPEHFAFLAARNELVEEEAIIWTHQRIIVAGSLVFVIMGALSLFVLPKEKWLFPINNHRTLLCVHWFFATPFLLGTLWQRLTVPKMAAAGRQAAINPVTIRNQHKVIGRITFLCSFGAATTALALSPRALAGGPLFAVWSIFWISVTLMAWRAARQRRFTAHKMWSEALSRTALAFVVGRLSLVAYVKVFWRFCSTFGDHEHIRRAYFLAVLVTWLVILYLTHDVHSKSEQAEKKARSMMAKRQIQRRLALFAALSSARNGDEDKKSL
eukprot:CAMPEP_0181039798 /NCGR_PEP_ID=MMETSP1070-20121207/10687_1 /TAXON_ID=265543 /ORGANISM="Minutocellus polymorphus, Strain NH13" /LENGTH=311 /DNA_ID=CAMNT_0023117725 /DNA_START=438 /DNA_END=1373 /DNA_ORIENTATION=-